MSTTPRRFTSHAEMQRAMRKHKFGIDDTLPMGYSKSHHGQVSGVRVKRVEGEGLGLTFERVEGGLLLKDVAEGSIGERHLVHEYIGCLLHTINGTPVRSNAELAKACEDAIELNMVFDVPHNTPSATPERAPVASPHPYSESPLHYSQRNFQYEKRKHRADIHTEPKQCTPSPRPHPYKGTSLDWSNKSLNSQIQHHKKDLSEGGSPHRTPSSVPPPAHDYQNSSDNLHYSNRHLNSEIRHHRSPLNQRSGHSPGEVGDYEGFFYERDRHLQNDGSRLHLSQKKFAEEKRMHFTPVIPEGSPSREAVIKYHHSHDEPKQEEETSIRDDGTEPQTLLELLQGQWVCGDGTPAHVSRGTVSFGNPPSVSEHLRVSQQGNVIQLLNAEVLSIVGGCVKWSDGDVWKSVNTRSPPQQHQQQPPSDPNMVVLYRTGSEKLLGIIWNGTTLQVNSISPGSPAERCGFHRFIGRTVISVNNIPFNSALALGESIRGGELQGALELYFEFDGEEDMVL
eukprot:TRINITY_DN21666_c0_g1_i1.p1 TRINITY_DN21666_c0_g1~~TRINITY_DN21666_c0_g1_i1.p1  ORF type:complete len:511 (+),score=99.82 TRINITY_DN21666_c0_g1_i1:39-1571(+)